MSLPGPHASSTAARRARAAIAASSSPGVRTSTRHAGRARRRARPSCRRHGGARSSAPPAVGQRRRPQHVVASARDQLLGERHHVGVVGVRLVQLEHRELGVVPGRDALVAEHPADLEDALEAADDEPLQVQLGRDPQVKVGVERVVVGDERPRRAPRRRSDAAPASRPRRSRAPTSQRADERDRPRLRRSRTVRGSRSFAHRST